MRGKSEGFKLEFETIVTTYSTIANKTWFSNSLRFEGKSEGFCLISSGLVVRARGWLCNTAPGFTVCFHSTSKWVQCNIVNKIFWCGSNSTTDYWNVVVDSIVILDTHSPNPNSTQHQQRILQMDFTLMNRKWRNSIDV